MGMTTDEDAIEMRVRSWANSDNSWSEPDVFFVSFPDDAPHHERLILLSSLGLIARVDGGDPGDENDGE